MDKQKLDEQTKDTLFEKGIILLNTKIERELLDIFRSQIILLQANEQIKDIKLLIDCGGGKVPHALVMCDLINMSNKPVIGIVNGICASMAVVVLQACTKRIITPNGWLFFHEIATNKEIRLRKNFKKEIEITFNQSLYLQKRIEILLSKRSGQTISSIKRLMRYGDQFDELVYPERALQLGFVDSIENVNLF